MHTSAGSKLAMICSALPPQHDGIGDYTSLLAARFSEWGEVTVHTVRGFLPDPIENVTIAQTFNIAPRRSFKDLLTAFDQPSPDWLIFQYNPFCYGDRGFNPYLPTVIGKLKTLHPCMKLAVMVHERFMPANSPRNFIMWAYQYRQFTRLTRQADLTLFSTGPWYESYRKRYPHRRACHMPVGSNLPFVVVDREAIRRHLRIPKEAIVLGSFGGNHASRLFGLLATAGRKLKSLGKDVRILSVGPAGPTIRAAVPELPLIDLGKLPPDQASQHLQAIDIYCSPFYDGISTRRGSFFAGLQQGLATVTTRGYNSDADLLSHADKAFMATAPGDESAFADAVVQLALNPDRRKAMAAQAKVCFDAHYSGPVLAGRWKKLMAADRPGGF